MSDLGTLIARIQEETHEPADAAVIRSHVASALAHFRPRRYRWSEKTATFASVIGQSDYPLGAVDGLPGDVMQIDHLRRVVGNNYQPLTVLTWDELRRLQSGGAGAAGLASHYAWHHKTLVLWPAPTSVYTLEIDYLSDATLDSTTGEEISVDSDDEFTNDFFTRGEPMLRARTISEYCMGRAGWEEMGNRMKYVADQMELDAMMERDLMILNRRARFYF